jgi:hypothetical protein
MKEGGNWLITNFDLANKYTKFFKIRELTFEHFVKGNLTTIL